MLFICYPKCGTCRKAQDWLDKAGVAYTYRDIRLDKPSEKELRRWQAAAGLPLKRFFNTSGLQYKALSLRERLPVMSVDEQFALLATDGMLVKRPILLGDGVVLVGFKPEEWEARLR
jgi:arsenate reductase